MKKALLLFTIAIVAIGLNSLSVQADELITIAGATVSSMYGTSNYYGGGDYAIDDTTATYWLGAIDQSPWWIIFDLGANRSVPKINLTWFSPQYVPLNYDIQVSDDGDNWEFIHTGIFGVYNATGVDRDINRSARYIRLFINEANRFPVLRDCRAYAEVEIPQTLRFQGILRSTLGNLLNGEYRISFRIYDTETNGDILWEETQDTVSISDGILDVELGSVTALDLAFDKQYWLSVEVQSNGEMEPRFKLTAVPYAFRAKE